MTETFQLGADGYFLRNGERFIPVGANWWPGSCGVELWQAWPEAEIQRDLDLLVELGLNTIRFFLRWQDFEPEPGRYDERAFARLDQLLTWCGERGLVAHPSLFVGFMSGGVFWPTWKEGANLFADPGMQKRSALFARRATEVIMHHRAYVLAIDQGNELCCLADSASAPPAAVRAWCAAVNDAIRSVWPAALIISGNEHGQIVRDSGWRFDAQPGCDLLSMHAYPMPTWHPVRFDGMTDPFAQSLLPFYAACARAFAPVFLQEFGTIITAGASQQEAYLKGMLPAAWSAGANGFLWWCLRDIDAPILPYHTHGFEGSLGLVDATGQVKPGLDYFIAFARSLATRPAPIPPTEATGLYWPACYWPRDEPNNAGNDPQRVGRDLLLANHLLRTLGHDVVVTRGDQPIPTGLHTLVIAGAHLRVDEAERLHAWVNAGGRLIWHGPDPYNWGPAYTRLIGARAVDYRALHPVACAYGEATWRFATYPRGLRAEVVCESAEVLAHDDSGLPVILRHRIGRGVVVTALPQIEEDIAAVADLRAQRDAWSGFYATQLASAQG